MGGYTEQYDFNHPFTRANKLKKQIRLTVCVKLLREGFFVGGRACLPYEGATLGNQIVLASVRCVPAERTDGVSIKATMM